MSHDDIVWYCISCLRFKVVYMLVRWTFVVEGVRIHCLNLGGLGAKSHSIGYCLNTITSWRLLQFEIASRCFSSPFIFLAWLSSEFSSSPEENSGFSYPKLFSLSSECSKVGFSSSFYLPLFLRRKALVFRLFIFFFDFLNKRVIIFLRFLIDSCWAWSISCCACCTRACSSISWISLEYQPYMQRLLSPLRVRWIRSHAGRVLIICFNPSN